MCRACQSYSHLVSVDLCTCYCVHPTALPSSVAVVEFKYSEGFLAENVSETSIPIIRHGNRNVTSQIRCNTLPISQNGTHLPTVSEDIRMGPGQSEAFCHVHIVDDHIWEGNSEMVLLEIEPLDDHTVGGPQSTFSGHIIDKEDSECGTRLHIPTSTHPNVHPHTPTYTHTPQHTPTHPNIHPHTPTYTHTPQHTPTHPNIHPHTPTYTHPHTRVRTHTLSVVTKHVFQVLVAALLPIPISPVPTVQFASPYTMEVEPLSNYSVDAKNVTLTLNRTGDPTQLLIVEFWTGSGENDNAGVANIDYQNTSGAVEFPPGVMFAKLHVALLSNHQRQQDFSFVVHIRKPSQATLPLIGAASVARVEVINRNLGPFFPDRPRVVSARYPHTLKDELSAYSPLLCVTVRKKECSHCRSNLTCVFLPSKTVTD